MFTPGQSLPAKTQSFLTALGLVMTVVFVSSVADQLISFFPMEMGNPQWRFGHFGTFMGSIPYLMTYLVLLAVVAGLAGSRMTVRASATLALIIGILAVPTFLFFVLDFVEVRRVVPVENRHNFDWAAIKTGIFGALFVFPAILTGWRGLQATADTSTAPRTKGSGLVVGS